jgi:dihydrodipicolinate synthase/N-acetylneuraminate lyase
LKDINGIVMPILTPFQEDGELDEPMGCALAEFLIGAMRRAGLSVAV